jgi:hypothetical protein
MNVHWFAVDILPEEAQFVWVHDEGENYMAYFYPSPKGGTFQTAESVGDREGLDVEYIYPTHWAYVETPENVPQA